MRPFQPREGERPPGRWGPLLVLGPAAILFAVWWMFVSLVYGLGTCGEDSDISVENYRRLCDEGGLIGERLRLIALAAGLVTAVVAALVWLRRAGWIAVGCAVIVLFGLGAVSFSVD